MPVEQESHCQRCFLELRQDLRGRLLTLIVAKEQETRSCSDTDSRLECFAADAAAQKAIMREDTRHAVHTSCVDTSRGFLFPSLIAIHWMYCKGQERSRAKRTRAV